MNILVHKKRDGKKKTKYNERKWKKKKEERKKALLPEYHYSFI
jgi:hypothetical protein